MNGVAATKHELIAVEANNTQEISNLPLHKKVIDRRWVYKVKHNVDGNIEKYKVTLVVKCFNQ